MPIFFFSFPFSVFAFLKSDFPWALLALPAPLTWPTAKICLYGLVRQACHELRNSSKFNSDGKAMKDSEENSSVNLEIALILRHNWQGEIGIVKTSFPKVEHFQSDNLISEFLL